MERRQASHHFYLIAFAILAAGAAPGAGAATLTWTPGNNSGDSSTWDTTDQNWSGTTTPLWDDTATTGQVNTATFNTAGTPTINIAAAGIYTHGITFTQGTALGGAGTITLAGTAPTIAVNANATLGSAVNWSSVVGQPTVSVTISGSQTLTLTGSLSTSWSGSGGFPSLTLSGAGLVNAGGTISLTPSSVMTVKGGATFSQTSGTTTAGNFNVGSTTDGTVSISGGNLNLGTNSANSTFSLGSNANGTLTVGGGIGTSNLSYGVLPAAVAKGYLQLGAAGQTTGNSTLNLLSNGTLKLYSGIQYNGGNYTLNLNGGTLTAGNGDEDAANNKIFWANSASVLAKIGANGFTFDSNNRSATIAQTLTDASGVNGTLTKANSGTLILSGANTYAGVTTVNGGHLVASANLSNGGIASAIGGLSSNATGNIVVNAGDWGYSGASAASTNRGFTLAGASGGLYSGSSGGITFNGAIAYGGAGAKTLTLTAPSGSAVGILNSQIADNGTAQVGVTLSYNGGSAAGTWTLSGANTYTGTTLVGSGILKAGSDSTGTTGPWGVNSLLNFQVTTGAARVADINGHDVSVGSISGGSNSGTGRRGEIQLTGSGKTLTIGTDNANRTYNGKITGAGNLTKVGSGNQTLGDPSADASGGTTFSGLTTIKDGTLSVSNLASGTSSLGTSAIHFGTETVGGTPKYGILNYTGASATSAHTLALDAAQGTVKVNSAATNLTLSAGNLSGTGTLIKDGAGTLTLSGNAVSGNTGVTTIASGTLALDYSGGSLTGNLLNSTTVNMSGGDLAVTGRSGAASTQTIADLYLTKTGNLRLTQNSASDLVVDIGTLHRTSGRHLNFSGLTLDAAGQPTNNADTGLGGARIKVDAILKPNGTAQAMTPGSKLGDWALVNGIGWACLDNDTTSGGGAVGDHYIAVAAFYDIYTAATDAAHSIVIQPGQNGFTGPTYVDIRINENGSGGPNHLGAATTAIDSLAMAAGTTAATVNMAFNNTTTGDTLVLGSDATVGGALAIFSGAKSLTVGQSAGQGFITGTASGNSTLAFMNNNAASTLTVNSVVKNNGSASVAVEVSGNGNGETTVFAGANTYTGGTTVDGNATLRLTGAGTLGNMANVANSLAIETGSTLDIRTTGSASFSGAISGGGTIQFTKTGGSATDFTVAGDNSGFTGSWRFNNTDAANAASTLTVNSASGLGGTPSDAATVTFAAANGGTLRFGSGAVSADYANVLVSGSGANLMRMAVATGTTAAFNGTIDATNTGGLTVGNAGNTGKLVLSGGNSYGGTTTVNNGTLLVNGNHTADGTATGGAVSGAYTIANGAKIGGTGLISTSGAFTMQGGAASTAQITGGDFGSIGTLTLDGAGNRILAGTYLFDVNYSQFTVGTPVNCSPSGTAADLIEVTGMTSGTLDLTNLKFGLGTQSGTLAAGQGYAVKVFEWDAGDPQLTGVINDGATLDAARTTGLLANQSIVRWGNAYYLVPEPGSLALLGLGSLLLLRRPTRRRGHTTA